MFLGLIWSSVALNKAIKFNSVDEDSGICILKPPPTSNRLHTLLQPLEICTVSDWVILPCEWWILVLFVGIPIMAPFLARKTLLAWARLSRLASRPSVCALRLREAELSTTTALENERNVSSARGDAYNFSNFSSAVNHLYTSHPRR